MAQERNLSPAAREAEAGEGMEECKVALRSRIRHAIRDLGAEERWRQSLMSGYRIGDALAGFLAGQRGQATVAAYLAFGVELDLGPLFARFAGVRWVFPRCRPGTREMSFHPVDSAVAAQAGMCADAGQRARARGEWWTPGGWRYSLEVGSYGIIEPVAAIPAVEPAEISLVIVPGMAFDRDGGRLGRGGGYYDRFLPRLNPEAPRWAVGYACQLVDDPVPGEGHDERVGWFFGPCAGLETRADGRDVPGSR